ncbi:unnamed protein product [Didymodactylos carnosus]|uniref:Putative auto-transporter adhesin head GIN domain-containing protein n=1 Tax=Didymodactylos carnosus TaxID=1234261 RepID=A0A814J4S4_9BILA|nr:unnamed protein product [Didymodactylos carnosus]CAF1032356.1 unnamed protein product [Didymodactylos carnosus]CAF3607592.1 unnamed protein product [Didymodactylos carnosus]CAF3803122.1 unnamed protein product [Didymodactylos carnosus]
MLSACTTSVDLNLDVPRLKALFYSTGKSILSGSCDVANIKSNGVSDVIASDLVAKVVNVATSGIGTVKVLCVDECNIRADSISTVYYRGPIKREQTNGLAKIKQW